MQREFFAMATGGPIIYSGRPLRQVHHHLAISQRESQRYSDCLMKTLEVDFPALSRKDLLVIIAKIDLYTDEITYDTNVDG